MANLDDHPSTSDTAEGTARAVAPGSDERPMPRPMPLVQQPAVRQEHPERLQFGEPEWR